MTIASNRANAAQQTLAHSPILALQRNLRPCLSHEGLFTATGCLAQVLWAPIPRPTPKIHRHEQPGTGTYG